MALFPGSRPDIAGLNAGVKWVNRIGPGAIHAREVASRTILRYGLAEIAASRAAKRRGQGAKQARCDRLSRRRPLIRRGVFAPALGERYLVTQRE